MSVLVTGGSGLVGLHVLKALRQRGHDAVGYSASGEPRHAESVLGDLYRSVTFIAGDIGDQAQLLAALDRHDVEGIIHTAGLTGEAQARADPARVIAVNVLGTANVLEISRLRDLRRVVYLGSSSEYGRRPDLMPIGENETNVQGLYAETKHLGYRLCERYRGVFGLSTVTVRVNSVYGPNTRFHPLRGLVGNTLVAHLTRAVARGESIRLDGGAEYSRGWTYVGDAAEGIVLAYESANPMYSVYNIASGRIYTTAEVVAALRELEPGVDIQVGAGQWEDDPFQAGNLRGPLDITRARDDLGYTPRFSLSQGLAEYVAWWRAVGLGSP